MWIFTRSLRRVCWHGKLIYLPCSPWNCVAINSPKLVFLTVSVVVVTFIKNETLSYFADISFLVYFVWIMLQNVNMFSNFLFRPLHLSVRYSVVVVVLLWAIYLSRRSSRSKLSTAAILKPRRNWKLLSHSSCGRAMRNIRAKLNREIIEQRCWLHSYTLR